MVKLPGVSGKWLSLLICISGLFNSKNFSLFLQAV